MEIYNISFNTEEVVLLDDNDWENLSATFPNLDKARQAPYVYNYDTEKVLVKCNNIHNLFDIFDKKLWASKTNPSKNLTGWQMYVILNKTVALPKYKKNFGVKFTIAYVSNICEEVWAMQKIEAWNLIYNKIKDNMHNTVVEHHNV